jgi:hypothetical protein
MKKIEVWFQDEARVGQHGTITRLWAEKGTRPRATRQLQYEFSYIFGAVCPSRDLAVGLVMNEIGIDAMMVHLKMISEQVGPGKIAVIVLDRASWHKSKKLNCFNNILLLPLPAASPELNPVEQLWQYLRDRFLANRVFEDMTAIVDACCDAWNAFVQAPRAITSLCTRSWAVL